MIPSNYSQAFSPTGKYLVSVGSQHDMIVNVFDWRANLKMASNAALDVSPVSGLLAYPAG